MTTDTTKYNPRFNITTERQFTEDAAISIVRRLYPDGYAQIIMEGPCAVRADSDIIQLPPELNLVGASPIFKYLKESQLEKEMIEHVWAKVRERLESSGRWPKAEKFPDIGNDPLKADGDERRELDVSTADRLQKGVAQQQAGVPDQTMLASRIDVSRLLDELTMRRAQVKSLRDHADLAGETEGTNGTDATNSLGAGPVEISGC